MSRACDGALIEIDAAQAPLHGVEHAISSNSGHYALADRPSYLEQYAGSAAQARALRAGIIARLIATVGPIEGVDTEPAR